MKARAIRAAALIAVGRGLLIAASTPAACSFVPQAIKEEFRPNQPTISQYELRRSQNDDEKSPKVPVKAEYRESDSDS